MRAIPTAIITVDYKEFEPKTTYQGIEVVVNGEVVRKFSKKGFALDYRQAVRFAEQDHKVLNSSTVDNYKFDTAI